MDAWLDCENGRNLKRNPKSHGLWEKDAVLCGKEKGSGCSAVKNRQSRREKEVKMEERL